MFEKIKNIFFGNSKDDESKNKVVLVKFPSECLVCEEEMNSFRINQPLCDECLDTLKVIIKKKKKKNERTSKKI